MMEEVQRYYEDRSIAPESFACKHRSDCSAGCETFVETQMPYIGR
jgi:hypothetical protein